MALAASVTTSTSSRSRPTSNQSGFHDDPSVTSEELSLQVKGDKKRSTKPRWMSQVKSWLSTSEPSAQAMKEQKVAAYKKAGIGFDDPQAAAKMHFPLGKVPAGAITSTSGPTPEKAFMERVKAKEQRSSYTRHSQGSHSMSSGFSSTTSVKAVNPIAPWEK